MREVPLRCLRSVHPDVPVPEMLLTVGMVPLPLADDMMAMITSLVLVVVRPVPIARVLVADDPVRTVPSIARAIWY